MMLAALLLLTVPDVTREVPITYSSGDQIVQVDQYGKLPGETGQVTRIGFELETEAVGHFGVEYMGVGGDGTCTLLFDPGATQSTALESVFHLMPFAHTTTWGQEPVTYPAQLPHDGAVDCAGTTGRTEPKPGQSLYTSWFTTDPAVWTWYVGPGQTPISVKRDYVDPPGTTGGCLPVETCFDAGSKGLLLVHFWVQ